MARGRIPKKGQDHYLPTETYRMVQHFCLSYGELKQAVSAILEDKKTIEQIIDEQPTIEPERKTGKWIKHYIGHEHTPWGFDCSECGEWFVVGEEIVKKYNYCPNCGADMRGEHP